MDITIKFVIVLLLLLILFFFSLYNYMVLFFLMPCSKTLLFLFLSHSLSVYVVCYLICLDFCFQWFSFIFGTFFKRLPVLLIFGFLFFFFFFFFKYALLIVLFTFFYFYFFFASFYLLRCICMHDSYNIIMITLVGFLGKLLLQMLVKKSL